MNCKPWYLKQIDLFKTLTEKELMYISEKFLDREYKKRQVVFEPQDKDKIFILKTGRVEIYELTEDGKKIIVDTLGPGNVFGDLGVSESSELFVEATTDSFVCTMKKNDFFEIVSQNPHISYPLIRELFAKTVESEKQVASLAFNNIIIKIKDLLFRLSKKHSEINNERVVITIKFTHEQLADMIGISRPTMTELLNKLDRLGIIKREGKIISYYPQKLASL